MTPIVEDAARLTLFRRYLDALEQGDRAALEAMLDPEVAQHERPNRLVPAGQLRDRAGVLEAFDRGKAVVQSQRYEMERAITDGERAALEVTWTARRAVPVSSLSAGETMRASFAIFVTFRGERILRQHNDDCFEPFLKAGSAGGAETSGGAAPKGEGMDDPGGGSAWGFDSSPPAGLPGLRAAAVPRRGGSNPPTFGEAVGLRDVLPPAPGDLALALHSVGPWFP